MTGFSLWVCLRCGTAIRSETTPTACFEDQGGCKRKLACATPCDHKDETLFGGPYPEGAKAALEIDARYRVLRLDEGLDEPAALDALDREREEPPEVIRAVLTQSCLLDEWPVGWREETFDEEASEWERLAKWLTFEDVKYWLGRVIDTSHTNLLVAALLAAQGRLHPLLREIGPAIHIIPVSGRFSAGKSRCAEILTYIGSGEWYATATVASLKRVRDKTPLIVGIDEGDEAEKMNPGVKAYLLASHDWGARYLRYSDADEKGKRTLEATLFGGPVIITFRSRPWPAIASRALIMEMEPSKDSRVSDDGDGSGFRRLLGPSRIWLRARCEEALRDKNALWVMRRTHEADFKIRLDRTYAKSGATVLRQRSFARAILLIAEVLGLDMARIETDLTGALSAQEVESENAAIIEAIDSDPLMQEEEVPVEAVRLSVQKFLREHREFTDLTRNRFSDVLKEMGFSKEVGPTWKRVQRDGRDVTLLFPALWRRNLVQGVRSVQGAPALHIESPHTPQTPQTLSEPPQAPIALDDTSSRPIEIGPGEAVLAMEKLLRELGGLRPPGAPHEPLLLRARDRGIVPDRAMSILSRLLKEGSIFVPKTGFYRLTEGLP